MGETLCNVGDAANDDSRMGLRSGTATSTGLVRETNEDSLFAGEQIFAVADGMGGHAAGEVASALVVGQLAALDASGSLKPDDIRASLVKANRAILDDPAPEREGMGTTVSGIAVVESRWLVFNIGDSRVYRYTDALEQVTVDHSEVEELVAQGLLTPEQALHYPRRNVLTRALGTGVAPDPDQWVLPRRSGQRFLLCTDGLTNELWDDEIASVLGAFSEPQAAADELVRLALESGGRDNVTVVVVDDLE